MKILKLLFLGAILLGAMPSFATPPRIVQSTVQLFAQSPTHIYVLRTLSDNSGSHFTDREDVYLTEINAETGAYNTHWSVASSVTNSVDGFPGEITQIDPQSLFVNPFEIARLKGATLEQIYDCEITSRGFSFGDWDSQSVPIKVQCGIYEAEPEFGKIEFYVVVPDWRS